MGRLDTKLALITGGSRGIGRAIAERFVEEGAKVFLVATNEERLQNVVAALGEDNAAYAIADVSDPEQTAAYVEAAVEFLGGLDIYVANAGLQGTMMPITQYPVETFDQLMAVNVRGVWLGLKHTIPHIAERGGGSIIVMSSGAGVIGQPTLSGYVASKHAQIGLVRTAALEVAEMGIRVNSINPGAVETDMMRSLEHIAAGGNEAGMPMAKQAFESVIPMKRYATPEEVASMAVFLGSDESSYITGAVHLMDGGITAS